MRDVRPQLRRMSQAVDRRGGQSDEGWKDSGEGKEEREATSQCATGHFGNSTGKSSSTSAAAGAVAAVGGSDDDVAAATADAAGPLVEAAPAAASGAAAEAG